MQLSVIIVNYNVRVFLEQALAAVYRAMQNLNGEIIVVDNASDDGSVEMLRRKFPSVRLIVNASNLGFGAANNIGFQQSQGDLVLLLNPDTIVQEDTFRTMIDFMNNHPGAGAAGCKVLNPDGSLQPACRRSFPTPWVALTKIIGLSALFPGSKLFARYNLTYLDAEQPHEVDALSGSFMVIRREVMNVLGGFDEQFFMYGEDLDLCYRIKRSGWKIYYTPSTRIIHYKGESTRRSSIDEVKMFYDAMRLFARKHFRRNVAVDALLQVGIGIREWMASVSRHSTALKMALLDFLCTNGSVLAGEYVWFGEIFHFPDYAYPLILMIPGLVLVLVFSLTGMYSVHRNSGARVVRGTVVTYLLISALTFFFKDYAFSRGVVLISGILNIVFLIAWRFILKSSQAPYGMSLFRRKTLIVGIAEGILKKIRADRQHLYEVTGFIDRTRANLGASVDGVEILGSIDNIGKVIAENRISDVIFSTDEFSFTEIVSVIAQARQRPVQFHLAPTSLELMVGQTSADEVSDVPLVSIEYKLHRPYNRLLKRMTDLTFSLVLMITVYPFVLAKHKGGKPLDWFETNLMKIPDVFRGSMSLVGPSESTDKELPSPGVFGKPGLTSLAQVTLGLGLTSDEYRQFDLYYAKNQSLQLDLKILLKTFSTVW